MKTDISQAQLLADAEAGDSVACLKWGRHLRDITNYDEAFAFFLRGAAGLERLGEAQARVIEVQLGGAIAGILASSHAAWRTTLLNSFDSGEKIWKAGNDNLCAIATLENGTQIKAAFIPGDAPMPIDAATQWLIRCSFCARPAKIFGSRALVFRARPFGLECRMPDSIDAAFLRNRHITIPLTQAPPRLEFVRLRGKAPLAPTPAPGI